MWNCWKLFQQTVLESDYFYLKNFTMQLYWVTFLSKCAARHNRVIHQQFFVFDIKMVYFISLCVVYDHYKWFFFRTEVLIKDNPSVKLAINLECGYATTKKIFKTGLLLSQWWLKKHFCLHLQSHSTWLGRQIFTVPSLTRSRFNKRPIYYLSTGLN